MITSNNVHLNDAHKTPQFWLLWIILCMNVSAGIGIIGAASPMLQETFAGALVGQSALGYLDLKKDAALLAAAAGVGAGFVGLISLFNIFGRIGWASSSDRLGRKHHLLHLLRARRRHVRARLVRGRLEDPRAVRRLLLRHRVDVRRRLRNHPRLPRRHVRHAVRRRHPRPPADGVVDGRHRRPRYRQLPARPRQAEGIAPDQIYGPIFYILAGLLVVGFLANLLVRPVNPKWHMSEDDVAAEHAKHVPATGNAATTSDGGIGMGGVDSKSTLFWLFVGIPLAWGIWNTVEKALVLFR